MMKNLRLKLSDANSEALMTLRDPCFLFSVFELEKKIRLFNKLLIDYKFYFSNVQPWEEDAIIFSRCIILLLCSWKGDQENFCVSPSLVDLKRLQIVESYFW